MIDTLIERTTEFCPPALYLVDDLLRARNNPSNVKLATIPTPPFQSPVVGWSIQEVKDHYMDYIPDDEGLFTHYTFIVLDERTLKDETCSIVSISTFDELRDDTIGQDDSPFTKYPPIVARADFWVALEALIYPESTITKILNDGIPKSWKEAEEDGGQFLYTKQRYREMFGPPSAWRIMGPLKKKANIKKELAL